MTLDELHRGPSIAWQASRDGVNSGVASQWPIRTPSAEGRN